MRFSTFSLLGLAGLALSRELTIMERQVQTIINVLNNLQMQATNLDSAIKAYTGGIPTSLVTAGQSVLEATMQGTQQVNMATAISVGDAVMLQTTVSTLGTTLESVVNDLIAKKPQLEAAGVATATGQILQQNFGAAQALGMAIVSKVPPELQSIAQQMGGSLTADLQKGIDAFGGNMMMNGASPSMMGGSVATSAAVSTPTKFAGAGAVVRPENLAGAIVVGAALFVL